MIRYCKPPCSGNVPCINICTHGKDTDLAMLTNDSDHADLSHNVQDQLLDNFHLPLPGMFHFIFQLYHIPEKIKTKLRMF